jgi:hypothetical protein
LEVPGGGSWLLSRLVKETRKGCDHLATGISNLNKRIDLRMGSMVRPNTWAGWSSTFSQFNEFREKTIYLREAQVELAFMMWIEAKILAKDISLSSAHQYVVRFQSIAKRARLDIDTQLITDYQRSLENDGALRVEHQAPPLTPEHYREARTIATMAEWIQLTLMWTTASRAGDFAEVKTKNLRRVREEEEGMIWSILFDTHKGDIHRWGVTGTAVLSIPESEALQGWLDRHQPEDHPIPSASADITNLLRRVDAKYTSHSVKRGALVTLLRAKVPLPAIQVIAKHRDLQTLLHYLPNFEVNEAMGIVEAAKNLCTRR